LVASIAHKLVLNVILQSAVVHSTQGIVVLSSLLCILAKLSSVLGCGCLLSDMLDLSDCDLLIVAKSVDASYLKDKRTEASEDALRVLVP